MAQNEENVYRMERLKSMQIGYLYLFSLIAAYKLGGEKSTEIEVILKKLREDPD